MPFIEWSEGISVGIRSIDDEHRHMIGLLNSFYEALKAGQSKGEVMQIFSAFIDTAEAHFRSEEAYFYDTGYGDAKAHKEEHESLIIEVRDVYKQYAQESAPKPSMDLATYLKDWFASHVIVSDMKYSQHLIACGIR